MISKLFPLIILSVGVCSFCFNAALAMNDVHMDDMDMLMCYKCSSQSGQSCTDPYKATDTDMINCEAEETLCLKLVYTNFDNKSQTIRSCASKNQSCNYFVSQLASTYGESKDIYCHECDTDHCNSAKTFGWSLLAVIIPVLVCYF